MDTEEVLLDGDGIAEEVGELKEEEEEEEEVEEEAAAAVEDEDRNPGPKRDFLEALRS